MTFNPTKIDDLAYAQDLAILWAQYHLAKDHRPKDVTSHLQNIASHCKHALDNNPNDPEFFIQQQDKARRLLKEMN